MKQKACGAVVFNKDKVLLVQRTEGFYEFPKGHVEKGETELQTAKREVKEETNIKFKKINGFKHKIYYKPIPTVHKEVVYFLGTAINTDTKPQETEVNKAFFTPVPKAYNLLTHKNHIDTLTKAKKYYKKNNNS